MRISRRPLAVAVVMVSVAACVGLEHLSSTAQKAVVFLPGSNYDFGNVDENTTVATSPDPYFTIRAQSPTDDDYVQKIQLQPTCGTDFALDLQSPLPAEVYCMGGVTYAGAPTPGQGTAAMDCTYVDYTFGATFTPHNPGSASCDIAVTTMPKAGGSAATFPLHLTGFGVASTFSMKVLPTTTLDFGDIALGSDSSDQSITVFNNGGATIDVAATNDDPTDFVSAPAISGTYNLPPGAFKTFQVHCHAGNVAATYSGTATFTTSASQGSLSASVPLACRAVTTSVSESPNPVDLGTHLLGDAPTTVAVVITNVGIGSVTVGSFGFSGIPAGEVSYNPLPLTQTLPPGQTMIANVRYSPTSERDTGPLGTMVFDAGGNMTNVPLRGGAHTGSIGTNPASVDFGTICAGNGSAIDVTVFANGGGDVTVSNPSGPSSPFSATLPGSGRTLLAHHGSEIALTAKVMTTGSTPAMDYTDTIGLATNIPGQATVPIGVHATVLAGGVAPTPGLVHFGPNMLETPSPVQTVTLTNCGAGPLSITDASIIGDPAEFAIVSGDPHVTIPQAGSHEFLVLMTAHSAGAKSAQLVFTYAGGTSTVALDGTGYGGAPDGGTKDRETYYACAVGAPTGALPIALAVFAARRRRRRRRA